MTHKLRALHDGILVGIDTVIADDPLLTVRSTQGARRGRAADGPRRIVVDSRLRLPIAAKMLNDTDARPWIATIRSSSREKALALMERGAAVYYCEGDGDGVCLNDLLRRLKADGIATLMVEGGGKIISSFLALGLVDLVVMTLGAQYIGGERAVRFNPTLPLKFRDYKFARVDRDMVFWGQPLGH
jgi:riboflavin-specific deaminase-like protein